MNWERVKNFLILLFIGINIFLVCIMFTSFKSSTSVNKTVIEDTVNILKTNGIAVDKSIIPSSFSNPGTFDVVAINVNSSYQSPKVITASNAESEIKKSLKVLGVKDYEIKQTDDYTYSIKQKTKGYYIFDSGITAKTDGQSITLEGVWYKQHSKPTVQNHGDGGIVYITGVLIDFISNPDRDTKTHSEITSVDMGYCVPSYDSGIDHKSMPAVPCYSITTADGTSFLYDAVSGGYIKSK